MKNYIINCKFTFVGTHPTGITDEIVDRLQKSVEEVAAEVDNDVSIEYLGMNKEFKVTSVGFNITIQVLDEHGNEIDAAEYGKTVQVSKN